MYSVKDASIISLGNKSMVINMDCNHLLITHFEVEEFTYSMPCLHAPPLGMTNREDWADWVVKGGKFVDVDISLKAQVASMGSGNKKMADLLAIDISNEELLKAIYNKMENETK